MLWLLRRRIGLYLADSIWILPCLGILSGLAAVYLFDWLERGVHWQTMSKESALALLGTLASSMFSFIVFVSSALLLAVQLASAQLTPRIISMLFRDRSTKLSLTLFGFSYTFTLSALVRVGDSVQMALTRTAAYSCVASLIVFLYLVDHVGKSFRPSGALRAVALRGREVIAQVYPAAWSKRAPNVIRPENFNREEPTQTIASANDGVVLSVNIRGLVVMAVRRGCVLEMVPQVGAFVSKGDPLFRVYGASGFSDRSIRRCVMLGDARTIEQDPIFAFRIIVDVACKALSPAINDPTTAVRRARSAQSSAARCRHARSRRRRHHRLPAQPAPDPPAARVERFRPPRDRRNPPVRRRQHPSHPAAAGTARRAHPDAAGATHRRAAQRIVGALQRSSDRFFSDPKDHALASASDAQGVGGKAEEPAKQ